MRLLIISDVHANVWALWAVEADAGPVDHILFAGDAVNYGPEPRRSIEWLEQHEVIGVRGNHDHAVAFGADPRASPAKQPLALAMRDWTREQIDPAQTAWLVKLPRQLDCFVGGVKFYVVHGTPVDPLYDYRLKPDCPESLLEQVLVEVKADVLVAGHTHLPLLRPHGSMRIVNPGSVGQPLDGDPRAAYAIWDDGEIIPRKVEYERSAAMDALACTGLPRNVVWSLQETLRQGEMK
jgi:putative phosphoesterase